MITVLHLSPGMKLFSVSLVMVVFESLQTGSGNDSALTVSLYHLLVSGAVGIAPHKMTLENLLYVDRWPNGYRILAVKGSLILQNSFGGSETQKEGNYQTSEDQPAGNRYSNL